jgi:hypothetical protein
MNSSNLNSFFMLLGIIKYAAGKIIIGLEISIYAAIVDFGL